MQLYKNFTPLVSIILTTYNRSKYLKKCIESVIAQTFTGWELIIIDDGSKDETFKVISGYCKLNQNIRCIKHSNRGPALSRNSGILASTGKYITFLDSDDEYEPDHLEKRVAIMEENDRIDCLHGGLKIMGDPYVIDKNDKSKTIHIKDCVVNGTFFGKRTMFYQSGGYKDLPYSSESEFYERNSKSYKFKRIDIPTYIYYRNTPDSICNNF